MQQLTITHHAMLLAMFLCPAILKLPLPYRSLVNFIVNLVILGVAIPDPASAGWMAAYILHPWLSCRFFKSLPSWTVVVPQILFFLLLAGYIPVKSLPFAQFDAVRLIGISYILFRQIDFILQAKSDSPPPIPFLNYFNFLGSFWTLIAGPIQRYSDFVSTFNTPSPPTTIDESLRLLNRAINGFLKILVVGVFFKSVVDWGDKLLMDPASSREGLAVVFYSYPIYLYMNFSGYCDIVIAGARWSGMKLPENFDRPYLATDLIDFWNRWHISLSEWVRDFLFQPLFKATLSTRLASSPRAAQYLCLFVTFLILGAWHGPTGAFIIFGALQGLGVIYAQHTRHRLQEKLGKKKYKEFREKPWNLLIDRVLCFHYVCFSFLFIGHELDLSVLLRWVLNFSEK